MRHSRHDSLFDSLSELGFGNFLHFREDHGGYLLGTESLVLTQVTHFDHGRAIFLNDLEWPVGHVLWSWVSDREGRLVIDQRLTFFTSGSLLIGQVSGRVQETRGERTRNGDR
jgi:hypothetical protein